MLSIRSIVMITLLAGLVAAAAQAQTETILYTFCAQQGCTDGTLPDSNLIMDAQGNFYGTTLYGGKNSQGVAFELTPDGTETVLHSFGPEAGAGPESLLFDAKGNLYGESCCTGDYVVGSVFELTKRSFKFLYRFPRNNSAQGLWPGGGLVMDSAGNLYGTTTLGGADGWGIVFKVTQTKTETLLYSFTGGADGGQPDSGVIVDAKGNLYGTTVYGGAAGDGVVFELTASGSENVLHTFEGGLDGAYPSSGLITDGQGNLYGTTESGGGSGCGGTGCGTVFKVTPAGVETILYSFAGGSDGAEPGGGLLFDNNGNLYGTTLEGGGSGCEGDGCGTVFKLTPGGEESILYSFVGGADGANPLSSLVLDNQGNFYGIAAGGHSSYCPYNGGACGVLYKVAP